MSKIKSKKQQQQRDVGVTRKKKEKDEDEDALNTSDDDYIDPSMEKYFNKKGGEKAATNGHHSTKSTSNGTSKSKNDDDDDDDEDDVESELEEEDEDEEEEEETDDEPDEMQMDDEMNLDEDEETKQADGRIKLTLGMIASWQVKLSGDKPFGTIVEVTRAFKSALLNVLPNKKIADAKYRVEGPELFNAMVRLCMRDLVPCWLKMLNLTSQKDESSSAAAAASNKVKLASSGSFWKKLKGPAKSYLEDLLSLINVMSEQDVLNSLLRHVRVLLNFYLCFPKLLKQLIKLLITTWSQGSDEKSRVIAFVCLHKIVTNTHEKNQDFIFKTLYLSFTRNSKFTSVNTLPTINFMQRSLVEIYASSAKLTYEHVFVYIRQLAIHLRNAMNVRKRESFQAVYNWQFVHSLTLWSKLLASMAPAHDSLKQLIYPLTQVIMGTIKLIPTPRYYPLRFHCIHALTIMSNATGVFIPILPLILDVFDITDFNKKHATISVKQLNMSFLLKLNKQQLHDKSFKDVLVDTIYDSLILLLQGQSHDIAFPELALPFILRTKEFLKKSKVQNYSKVMKGLLDKVNENCKFIEEHRAKATFSLRDKKAVDAWMDKTKQAGTPLSQWYSRYKTLRERELMMEASNKEQISKNKVPLIERPTSAQKAAEKRELSELFFDESGETSDTELLDFVPKKKQKKSIKNEEEMESEDDFEEAVNGGNPGGGDDNDNDDDDAQEMN